MKRVALALLVMSGFAHSGDWAAVKVRVGMPSKPTKPQIRKSWKKLCPLLGEAFLVGKGPMGYGFAVDYSCAAPGEKVEGDWRVEVSFAQPEDDDEGTIIRFYREGELLSQASAEETTNPLEFISSNADRGRVVASLLDPLPALMRLTADNFDRETGIIQGGAPVEDLSPLETLRVYTLREAPGGKGIRAHVLGDAQLVLGADGEPYKWQFSGEIPSSKVALFAHNAEGPGRVFRIEGSLATSIGSAVVGSLEDTLRDGYVGARLGLPLLSGDVFGSETRFLGIVSEFRGGPMEGFKLFLDYWLPVSKTVDGLDAYFGGYRLVLGWNFSFALSEEWGVFAGATPKLGVWSMGIKLPVQSESISFDVANATSLGMDFNLEVRSGPYIVRANYGKYLGVGTSSTRVFDDLIGGEIIWNLGPTNLLVTEFGTSILAFSFYETFVFKKDDPIISPSGLHKIEALEYSQAYLGGGVALSW